MKRWVKMPSQWIIDNDGKLLRQLKWQGNDKSDNIAALILYLVFLHHANDEITSQFDNVGCCNITYEALMAITGLSKAKISGGIKILLNLTLISVERSGNKNIYMINGYGSYSGWAKLPAKRLYAKDMTYVPIFHDFKLRSRVELNALKVYLLILALRNNTKNTAAVSYDKITKYTGVLRNDVRRAVSFLVTLGLVHVDQYSVDVNQYSTSSSYRPCFIDSYNHAGTSGKASI